MPIISQLNTANTFSQWLTGTQDLITRTNSLVEGGSGSIFYSNTNLSVANNLTIGGDGRNGDKATEETINQSET